MKAARRGQSDLRAIAAYEVGREAEAAGDTAAALAALDMSRELLPPYPWQLHALKARLLIETGDVTTALAEIERAMQWNHYEGRFEGMLPKSYDEMRTMFSPAENRAAS